MDKAASRIRLRKKTCFCTFSLIFLPKSFGLSLILPNFGNADWRLRVKVENSHEAKKAYSLARSKVEIWKIYERNNE